MIVAALAHVSGNLPALEAALACIDDRGVIEIFAAGNIVHGYPWPREVVDRLRERNARCVMGEYDRRVAKLIRSKRNANTDPALRWTYETLSTTQNEWVRGLPTRVDCALENVSYALFHGTPANVGKKIDLNADGMLVQRVYEETRAQVNIFCGDGAPCSRVVSESLFVQCGPAAGAGGAHIAFIDTDANPFSVTFEIAPYNVEEAETAAANAGLR